MILDQEYPFVYYVLFLLLNFTAAYKEFIIMDSLYPLSTRDTFLDVDAKPLGMVPFYGVMPVTTIIMPLVNQLPLLSYNSHVLSFNG